MAKVKITFDEKSDFTTEIDGINKYISIFSGDDEIEGPDFIMEHLYNKLDEALHDRTYTELEEEKLSLQDDYEKLEGYAENLQNTIDFRKRL